MRSLLIQIRRPVIGQDGPLGQVEDVYFDDETWDVLWFVVRLAASRSRENILIPPEDLEFGASPFPGFRLRRPEIPLEEYPVASSRLPVSRQKLVQISETVVWASSPFPLIFRPPEVAVPAPPHLRSCCHVKNYDVWSPKRRLGRIDDFLWDPKSARIVAFRVLQGWWRRRLGPLVPTGPGIRVSWPDFRVYVGET